MRKLASFLCLLLTFGASGTCLGQCGYSPALHTNKDYCVGSSLIATSTHAFQDIVWYKDGQPVKTVTGTQSFAANPVTIPVPADNPYGLFAWMSLPTDDAGNIYVSAGGQEAILKWTPGIGNGFSVIGTPYTDFIDFTVDRSGNLFLLNGDSGTSVIDLSLVLEYPAGSRDSADFIAKPIGHTYTYGSAYGLAMDCQQNVYILSLENNLTKWLPGAGSGELISSNGGVTSCSRINDPGLKMDRSGNFFYAGTNNVQKVVPGSSAPVPVTGYYCQSVDSLLMGFWIDANDTIYTTEYLRQNKSVSIQKWAPGSGSGKTILSFAADQGVVQRIPLTMDVKGNIFLIEPLQQGLLEFVRTTSIDSAYTPSDTGTYYAVVTDIRGYTAYTDTIHINMPTAGSPSIAIGATATSTPVCTPITFSAVVGNPGYGPSYQWMVSGVPVGGDSTTYTNNLFANGDQVYCILSTQAGCAGPVRDTSNVIDLSIDPHGTASVTISTPKDSVCEGKAVVFTATVTNGSNQAVFEWLLNGIPVGDDSATFGRSNFSTGDVVTCLITSDDACGLAKSNSIPLLVSIPPYITRDQIFTIPYGHSLKLTPQISGDVNAWLWTPATGLSDVYIADPVADPAVTILYTLAVGAAGGCADTATILVNVYTPLAIPNAFTPNGDGRNDRLYVLGGPVNSVVEEFVVYNRWGQQLFHVHNVAPGDAGSGWDGRVGGAAAPAGIYVYMVRMKFADGSVKAFNGTVMLVR